MKSQIFQSGTANQTPISDAESGFSSGIKDQLCRFRLMRKSGTFLDLEALTASIRRSNFPGRGPIFLEASRRMAGICPILLAFRSAMHSSRYRSTSVPIVILSKGCVSVNWPSSALAAVSLSQRRACAAVEKVCCTRRPPYGSCIAWGQDSSPRKVKACLWRGPCACS